MKEIESFPLPISREQFCKEVQDLIAEKKIPVMDAIIMRCEAHEIELEDVAPLIDAKMKCDLEQEFRNMNYLPKIGTLPL
jgi:uncharacterized protein (DUF39 family)